MRQVIVTDNGHSDVEITDFPRVLSSRVLSSQVTLDEITSYFDLYPDITIIHLTIGDNNFAKGPGYEQTTDFANQASWIIADVRVFVDHVLTLRPDVKILWSGYDYFRPKPWLGTPAELNAVYHAFGELCAAWAATRAPSVTYSDIYGATQVAMGFDGVQHTPFDPGVMIPPGDPSLPDSQWPGPIAAFLPGDTDHLNNVGWKILAEVQYESFYSPLLNDAAFTINAGLNGNWWNGPARDGEGVQIEVSDDGNGGEVFVATIYSYSPSGNQIFLIAVGAVSGDTVEADVFISEGGVWGEGFDPVLVEQPQWGIATFFASSCDSIQMELTPNAQFEAMGYTGFAYDLVRLTTPAVACPITNPN